LGKRKIQAYSIPSTTKKLQRKKDYSHKKKPKRFQKEKKCFKKHRQTNAFLSLSLHATSENGQMKYDTFTSNNFFV